jgi:serine/threonine protein kinase
LKYLFIAKEMSWDPWAADIQAAPFLIEHHTAKPKSVKVPSLHYEEHRTDVDFLSILALAQCLHIDFLPIVWHPELEIVGVGASAEVRQALINVQMGLAFKRVTHERQRAFSALFSEISILGYAAVLDNENIVSLEGICWDVDPIGPVVWPVLVFRKAPHGNLSQFMQSAKGNRLTLAEVLSIAADIAKGIICLHSHGMNDIQYHFILY